MVRLKEPAKKRTHTIMLFQFLYGAIKRQLHLSENLRKRISIPLWCD